MPINIWGRYKRAAPEIIDTAESMKDAVYMVGEYRIAYGQDWLVWHGRRKDGGPDEASKMRLRD